jgi:23S rRNA (adenine2503-C2)-methyltransferase
MKDIREISAEELQEFVLQTNEKAFRAKQINEWLWKKGVGSFNEMNNIGQKLKDQLSSAFTFHRAQIELEAKSSDTTVKFGFRLHDGKMIEGVLIPAGQRVTACVSTQVGCAMHCAFCATGQMGFIRNLHYAEIFDQYMLMNSKALEYYGNPISNIVYMGMGEPLLNMSNVLKSIELLTSKEGQGLSPQRITLSTAGIIEGIRKLADLGFKPGLAVSLHSADPHKRIHLMPVTEHNPLDKLQEVLKYYHQQTGERVTFEYLLLKDINDSQRDAEILAAYCRAFPVKINLIEFNATDSPFQRSEPENVKRFIQFLESRNMVVNLRHSRGKDIAAACGQLIKK